MTSVGRTPTIADIGGATYLATVTVVLVVWAERVAALTAAHPYPMGFLKFALLATFGECLKTRIVAGHWLPEKLGVRAMVWGGLGLWITVAFPFVDGGVRSIASAGLWPYSFPALWMSAWTNLFGGIGPVMMFTHYWVDTMLIEGPIWPWRLFGRAETVRWAKIVILALLMFWTPAHTLTFSLPPTWRILCAAYLGIALGLILSIAARRS